EDLLEPEELHDPQVHRGVEPQPALVRAERRVELDAEAAVDADLAGVVDPRHTEDDLPLRLAQALQHGGVDVVRVPVQHGSEALEDLGDGLVELTLTGVAREDLLEDALQ